MIGDKNHMHRILKKLKSRNLTNLNASGYLEQKKSRADYI